jgi:hypothetical protein
VGKSFANEVSRMKISKFLLDTMQARKKHDEAKAILVEFYPHCRQKKRDYKYKMVANLEADIVVRESPWQLPIR